MQKLHCLKGSVAVVLTDVGMCRVDHPQSPKHQVTKPSTQNDSKEQPEVVRHDNQHEEVTHGNLHHMEQGLHYVKNMLNCIHLGSEREGQAKETVHCSNHILSRCCMKNHHMYRVRQLSHHESSAVAHIHTYTVTHSQMDHMTVFHVACELSSHIHTHLHLLPKLYAHTGVD